MIFEKIGWNQCTELVFNEMLGSNEIDSETEEVIETVESYVDTKLEKMNLDGGAF